MAEGTRMTHLSNSLRQVEDFQRQQGEKLQDHMNQLERLTEALQVLATAQNETNKSVARIEKLLKGKEVAQDYEKEVPAGIEGRNFQENEMLENTRNRQGYSEERKRNKRQNEEGDHQRYGQQNQQEMRRFGRGYDEDQWERCQQPRPTRLDFFKFDGDNPTGWIYKVEQFFYYYQTAERQKLKMDAFHMEGDALIWFQDSEDSGYFTHWRDFTEVLLLRFEPAYDDQMESITRLRQTSTVTLYKTQFEVLSNRLKGLFEKFKLICFLSSLKDEIRLPLRLLSPRNLNKAFAMAKIQEECVLNSRRTSKFNTYTNLNWQNNRGNMVGDVKLEGGYKKDNSSSMTQKSTIPIQKLSLAQIEDRRKKGLCYTCNEKWNRNHICTKGKIYMLEGCEFFDRQVEEDSLDDQDCELEELAKGCTQYPEISLHAITESPNLRTMRLWGMIKYQWVIFLIDSGSSHNFLDASISSKLALDIQQVNNIAMKVTNGQIIHTKGVCKEKEFVRSLKFRCKVITLLQIFTFYH
jgi:hypothetical protein